MKIQPNQIDNYEANGYEFKKRSKPKLIGGQTVQIETYNKTYKCGQKPKLLFLAICSLFTNLAESKENWRALFTGKKIVTAQVPFEAHKASDKEIDELVQDKEILDLVLELREYVFAENEDDDFSEEEIKALEAMGREDLQLFIDCLNGNFKGILKEHVIEKLRIAALGVSHTPSKFKGSEFRVKELQDLFFKVNVYVEEEKKTVFFDGFSYPLKLELMQRIFQGYAWQLINQACLDNEKIEELLENKEMKEIIKVQLKSY